ncbi:MAG TPA: response regulator transcription factor [Pyrinomonadaceae bacterium]|nr:response regulator transcription factor [Pyrinomonadaceae bacterium]
MVNILLADDHYVVRRGLRELLHEHHGWQICGETSNGREAVKLALKLKPDVVVLDLLLPELNAVEAARQILHDWPKAEVLIFMDNIPYSQMTEALLVGVRGFVLKTDGGENIIDAVEALSHHRPYFSGNIPEALLDVFLKRLAKLPTPTELSILTDRELKIVQMIAGAHSNTEVAEQLGISIKTVETHRATAMRKLGINSVVHLVHYAVRNQLVEVRQFAH